MIKRSALGRGLGALIEENDIRSNTPDSNEVSILEIEANPFQPRVHFDEEALNDLATSIKELGIIQPITLRKLGDQKYQIIAGERRFRAAKIAGLTAIPSFIREAGDETMLEMALVENIQREDLDAIEIALSYHTGNSQRKSWKKTFYNIKLSPVTATSSRNPESNPRTGDHHGACQGADQYSGTRNTGDGLSSGCKIRLLCP